MPIHEISRRWIRSFETGPADRLMRLRDLAEKQELDMSQFRSLDIVLELDINASRATVWKALTADIQQWWPAKFYVGSSPKRFLLEPRVGGRLYEDWGDDAGVLFGTITVFNEESQLQWAGDMSADFGGPARSVTTFQLKADKSGKGTSLTFRDTPYGLLSDMAMEHLEQGWQWLLSDCFKPFIENGKSPERPDTLVKP